MKKQKGFIQIIIIFALVVVLAVLIHFLWKYKVSDDQKQTFINRVQAIESWLFGKNQLPTPEIKPQ